MVYKSGWSRLCEVTSRNQGGIPCPPLVLDSSVPLNPIPLVIPFVRTFGRYPVRLSRSFNTAKEGRTTAAAAHIATPTLSFRPKPSSLCNTERRDCVRAAASAVLRGSFHAITERREFRLVVNDEFDKADDAEEFNVLEFDKAEKDTDELDEEEFDKADRDTDELDELEFDKAEKDTDELDELEFDKAEKESRSASGVGPCTVSARNVSGSLSATEVRGCATEGREHLL